MLLFETIVGMFSKNKRNRCNHYSTMFKIEFFDQCLSFDLPSDSRTPGEASALEIAPPSVEFNDPLQDIADQENSKLVYQGRLSVFKGQEGKLGRITQVQIKQLYELLNIAVNDNLDFHVRGVAVDQIGEALYFYRDQPALGDFCKALMNVCIENMREFGNKRENFSTILAKLRPLDESFISTKSAKDLPLQNKHYKEEKTLVSKYLQAFNIMLVHFKLIVESRQLFAESLFADSSNKGICRSLWILATDRQLELRY